jgi:hypothetical protein
VDSVLTTRPAARLVTVEMPKTLSFRDRAAITSITVDIPTASAPIFSR